MSYFNEVTIEAFEDELEKIAGIGDFLSKGIRGWQWAARGAAKAATEGAKGGRAWGAHPGLIKKIYQKGAEKGGWWGGVRNVAKSRYGSMAATGGLGLGAAGYGANMLFGKDRGRQEA